MASSSSGENVVRAVSLMKSEAPPTEPDTNSDSDSSLMAPPEEKEGAPSHPDVDAAGAGERFDSDAQLMARAEVLYKEDKILEATNLLRKVKDTSLLSELHTNILNMGTETEDGISDVLGPPGDAGSGWKQQKANSSRPTNIYTKMDANHHLSVRIDSVVAPSLLIPLLSVINETELFSTWMPSSTVAHLGIRETNKLKQLGRVHQIVQILLDMPWPLCMREFIIHAYAVDDIEDQNFIAIPITSLVDSPLVPKVQPNRKRLSFDGMLLFRACPEDHELLVARRQQNAEQNNAGEDNADGPMVLVTFKAKLHADLSIFPTVLVNYVTKTIIGLLWSLLLGTARDIKEGKRPKHKEAIESKGDLYQWIEQRANVMLSKLQRENASAGDNNNQHEEEQFVSYLQG